MKKVLFIVALTVLLYSSAVAQATSDDEDFQSWNDLQLTVPMTKQFDFYTALTFRFGRNVSQLQDGRYAIGFVYKPTKALSIMPFYWRIRARNSKNVLKPEDRLSLRATYRFPIKSFGLTHRSSYEYRIRPPVNTWRYRAALTFDKDIPEHIIPKTKFFFGDEIFYDSATHKFSRNRFNIGITKTISKHAAVDIYYMRQNDGYAHPGDLNVIWTAWKIKL
jgi:Protein of unknown function (DUF2490)